jgi:hypothetical protein
MLMANTLQEDIIAAIVVHSGEHTKPRVRNIEKFVLKPMMEAGVGARDLRTNFGGVQQDLRRRVAKLCGVIINADEAPAGDASVAGRPSTETVDYARLLKQQYGA